MLMLLVIVILDMLHELILLIMLLIHHNYGYYGQELMSIVNSSSFDATSNMQHVNPYSSAISSQYVNPL